MFTVNYPLLITHIIREARLYLQMLQRLQNREQPGEDREALNLEFFWNRQMAEHAKFIRGLLDPTENDLFDLADNFGDVFDRLTAEAKAAIDMTAPRERVTEESLRATQELRDFKEQGTQGILACQIKSIIIPLLGDHVLREANHYLRLLRMFER
jgi:gamma-glutamyl:cysteine ligase YbdK (ATP-grasp superfamily)